MSTRLLVRERSCWSISSSRHVELRDVDSESPGHIFLIFFGFKKNWLKHIFEKFTRVFRSFKAWNSLRQRFDRIRMAHALTRRQTGAEKVQGSKVRNWGGVAGSKIKAQRKGEVGMPSSTHIILVLEKAIRRVRSRSVCVLSNTFNCACDTWRLRYEDSD